LSRFDGEVLAMALLKKGEGDVVDLYGAARFLKISTERLLVALERDVVPARKIAGEWRFHREALGRWMAEGSSRRYGGEFFYRLTAFNLSRLANNALWLV
jgi:hypothetical protein